MEHDSTKTSITRTFTHLGALGRNRTYDLRIRSPLLYPTELQGHGGAPNASLKLTKEADFYLLEHPSLIGSPLTVQTEAWRSDLEPKAAGWVVVDLLDDLVLPPEGAARTNPNYF